MALSSVRRALPSVGRVRQAATVPNLVALARVAAVAVFVEVALHRKVELPRLSGWLGVRTRFTDSSAAAPSSLPVGGFRLEERRQVRVARRLFALRPFADGPCLRQSLVVGHALRRHRPTVVVGVIKVEQGFAAHAWLEIGGVSLEADRGYLPLGL